jgi:hypothetical protein
MYRFSQCVYRREDKDSETRQSNESRARKDKGRQYTIIAHALLYFAFTVSKLSEPSFPPQPISVCAQPLKFLPPPILAPMSSFLIATFFYNVVY